MRALTIPLRMRKPPLAVARSLWRSLIKEDRLYKAITSIFIIASMYITLIWLWPESPARNFLAMPIRQLVAFWCLSRQYIVFCPPGSLNYVMYAKVHFDDGTVATWQYPSMYRLNLVDKFFQERFHKLGEHINRGSYNILVVDCARYVAYKHNTPTRHPVRVELFKHWEPVPPSELLSAPNAVPQYADRRFLNYRVRPEDLR